MIHFATVLTGVASHLMDSLQQLLVADLHGKEGMEAHLSSWPLN
ncbi:hypothetical protein [Desulfogranum marinum]|nr:hypothetical protein [Desulfogranum marinum]